MRLLNDDFSWIWNYLKKYRFMTYITIIGSMIEIILFSMPSIFIAIVVGLYLNDANPSEIYTWLWIMILVALIQIVVFYIVATVNEFLAHRVTTDMTYDLFESLQNRPMHFHDRQRIGDIMARATGDTRVINIGLSPAIRVLGQVFTAFIFAFSVLLSIHIRLSMILILSFPIFVFAFVQYGKNLAPLSLTVQERFSDLNIYTSESFTNIRDIKSYNIEDNTSVRFSDLSKSHASQIRNFGIKAAYYYPGVIFSFILASTALIGVYYLIDGSLELEEFVLFVGLVSTIGWLSRNLQFVSEFAARTGASAGRIRSIIQEEVYELKSGDIKIDNSKTNIKFDKVSFSYDHGKTDRKSVV